MNPISNYIRPEIANSNSVPTPATSQGTRGAAQSVEQIMTPSQKSIQPDVLKAYDEKTLKQMGVIECSTCANRTYQDGSDDSGYLFNHLLMLAHQALMPQFVVMNKNMFQENESAPKIMAEKSSRKV